jgi:acetylornithine deacetylase/succinyl-diaminopimelate desuccinylase-like protein
MTTTSTSADLEDFLDVHQADRIATFVEFLRIPSISGMHDYAADCRRAAEFLADDLRSIGFENVDVSETGGHPIVYGDWLHASGAPTVLVYGHYDVQPVDPLELWEKPPFEPIQHDGRMFARGAADDKGQIQMHIRAAEALLRTRDSLPVNLRFMFEGEEEASSEHIDDWIEANRQRLNADVVVISDTSFFAGNTPAITLGLRGLTYVQIDVTGPTVDLHSGQYGGIVENPANALAHLIAALKGPDGRIRIPHFYDDVATLTDDERDALAALPFDEDALRDHIGVPALVGEVGYSTLERKGTRPTLDVDGIWGGFQGEGPKTIIPAHAHAKVSCRLVPNQDPQKIFDLLRDYVLSIAPPGVRVDVSNLGLGKPSLTPMDHPATQAASRAIESAFGRAPLYSREGGSIPVCDSFETILGLPVVLAGFVNEDSNAHAPNESLVMDNYDRGIRAIVAMWDEFAAIGGELRAPPAG